MMEEFSEASVKKSVDITEKDEDWIEDNCINFSQYIRKQLAQERLEEIPETKKQLLYSQIIPIANKAEELRNEWNQEVEDLEQEYDVKLIETNSTHWIAKYDGRQHSGHWVADDPFQGITEEVRENMPEEVREFGEEFVQAWVSKLENFEDFVSEETSLCVDAGDESTQTLEGQGPLNQFTVYMGYLSTDPEYYTIKFEDKVHLDFEDLEEVMDN